MSGPAVANALFPDEIIGGHTLDSHRHIDKSLCLRFLYLALLIVRVYHHKGQCDQYNQSIAQYNGYSLHFLLSDSFACFYLRT